MRERYVEQVFALKDGSAINLFYRDMSRLSVDIDLTHVPIEDRAVSLQHIDQAGRQGGSDHRAADRAPDRARALRSVAGRQ